MANIQFRLNDGRKINDPKKEYPVYVRYKKGSHFDFHASLGIRVAPADWDENKQRVRDKTHLIYRVKWNNLIENIYTHLREFDVSNLEKGITPNYKQVKAHYESFFSKPEDKKQHTLLSYISEFITRPDIIKNVSVLTIRGYKVVQSYLQRFNDEVYKIDFDNIDLDWYHDFIEWCENQNQSKNYIGKHIKTLKTFLNRAVEEGITDNTAYKSPRFKVLKEEAENIYLNNDELLKIWNLNLSKEPRKENARDLFLIGAFTGLRVSDFNRLKRENLQNINGVNVIKVKTKKTGKEVTIPVHPIVKGIIDKNNGNPPKRMPDQNINNLIKVVAESAEIDEPIHITKTVGGKEVTTKKYKFDLVMNHTARRSFCTNAYLNGVSTIDIMGISGHTTEKAFMNYIKVTDDERAIRMSQHEFFNPSNNLKAI